jgi:hypothetical protein
MRLQTYINESGYSRMMQVISGLVPSVKTFAIITWENPLNNVGDDKFNSNANRQLKQYLRDAYYSYRHIKGRYDRIENPYLIMNIKLSQAKHIGFDYKEFKQESIIYGQKFNNNKNGVMFKMIYHDNRKPDIRRIWTTPSKDSVSMYSEYKGRKFKIPFFDDEFKHFNMLDGKKQVIEDHNIYSSGNISNNTLHRLNGMRDEALDEGMNGYPLRGRISLELKRLRYEITDIHS